MWFSRYIRLRDAIEYCMKSGIDIRQFNRVEDIIGKCCTCKTVKSWIRMDCGHYIGKGIGGASGIRWDERNAHLQCKQDNAFNQGAHTEYRQFMENKYSQKVIDELEFLHKNQSYKGKIVAIGEMYKQMYLEMLHGHQL